MKYPHLAARVFNTPLLIHPQKLDAIIAGLGHRLLGAPVVDGAAMAREIGPELFSTRNGAQAERGYRVVDGVAVLSVNGALVHRSRFDMSESSFTLGYNDLAADLEDAMGNPDVHAVLQVYDSPGGEAQGAFEYADRVHALRGRKPLIAIADGMAASAAYLGASAADEVVVTRTGYAGSVGVVMRHVDLSRALANDGVAVTHIYAGAHKVDGNPYEPLPAAVRSDFQAEIDSLYSMFIEAVAGYRRISGEALRKTEANTYAGVAAIAAGLADRLGTTDALISELAALRARSFSVGQTARANANDKGASMSGTPAATGGQQPANPSTPTASAFSQADLDRARTEGNDSGTRAERDRVTGIFAHPAAASNMSLSIQCVNAGLSVEQANGFLSALPTPAAPAAAQANSFAAAMATLGNPQVSGIEAKQGDAASQEAELAGQILASFRA
jgi:signal peptide peptidase SppA